MSQGSLDGREMSLSTLPFKSRKKSAEAIVSGLEGDEEGQQGGMELLDTWRAGQRGRERGVEVLSHAPTRGGPIRDRLLIADVILCINQENESFAGYEIGWRSSSKIVVSARQIDWDNSHRTPTLRVELRLQIRTCHHTTCRGQDRNAWRPPPAGKRHTAGKPRKASGRENGPELVT